MKFAEYPQLAQILRDRCEAIANTWYGAIAGTSFTAVTPMRVRWQLKALVEHATTAMLSEPFDRHLAQSVGAGLARLHYVTPESLSRTQETLSQQFVEGLPEQEASAVRLRLAALLGEVGAGFFAEVRRMILHEQEEIRGALFNAYQQTQRALAISEQQFRSAFDDAATGMALITLEGRFLKVNRALCTIFGYEELELLAMDWQGIIHTADRAADDHRVGLLLHGETSVYQAEQRYYHQLGHVLWIALSVSLVRGVEGKPVHFIAQFQDITERREAVIALRISEERLRAVVTNAPVILFAVDRLGILTLIEGKGLAALDIVPGALVGRSYFDLPDAPSQILRNIGRALGDEEFDAVVEVTGEIFEIRYAPLHDTQGEVAGAIGVATNITERRRAEYERTQRLEQQAAREAAEEALRVREVFLSIAAHELRTPLATLLGHATILERRAERDQSLPARLQQGLATITQQGRRLNTLVETLLDLSQLQQGRLVMLQQPVDLNKLVRWAVADVQLTVEQHILLVETPETSIVITGDEQRLEQIVLNLLSNAIKYSPTGGLVRLRLTQTEECAVISVSDQGIGIPQAAQPHLFQQFFRASNVDPKQISGLGIGLYLVHEIVTLHGGGIAVESQEGVGSTFSVSLPLRHSWPDDHSEGVAPETAHDGP